MASAVTFSIESKDVTTPSTTGKPPRVSTGEWSPWPCDLEMAVTLVEVALPFVEVRPLALATHSVSPTWRSLACKMHARGQRRRRRRREEEERRGRGEEAERKRQRKRKRRGEAYLLERRAARGTDWHVVLRREGEGRVGGGREGKEEGGVRLGLCDGEERDSVGRQGAVGGSRDDFVALEERVDALGRAVGQNDRRRRREARVGRRRGHGDGDLLAGARAVRANLTDEVEGTGGVRCPGPGAAGCVRRLHRAIRLRTRVIVYLVCIFVDIVNLAVLLSPCECHGVAHGCSGCLGPAVVIDGRPVDGDISGLRSGQKQAEDAGGQQGSHDEKDGKISYASDTADAARVMRSSPS